MRLKKNVRVSIFSGEDSGYVAECLEIPVVTQGQTLDEVTSNVKEAIELYFEDENPIELGFSTMPNVIISFEVEPEYAKA